MGHLHGVHVRWVSHGTHSETLTVTACSRGLCTCLLVVRCCLLQGRPYESGPAHEQVGFHSPTP